MPRALIDTTVLLAETYRQDSAHDEALPILSGIDTADLPEVVIPMGLIYISTRECRKLGLEVQGVSHV